MKKFYCVFLPKNLLKVRLFFAILCLVNSVFLEKIPLIP